MNKDRENILLPVGRIVEGSLYTFTTQDMNGKPRVYESGPRLGQPKPEFFFSLAVPKKGEQSWAQTLWGKQIYDIAVRAFPRGEHQSPEFSWKIVDGDGAIPNNKGVRPCDRQGYPGCWVVRLKTTFAPGIINPDTGLKSELQEGAIQLGDYLQPIVEVMRNSEKSPKPGMYITPKYVAFCGYGERIQLGINPQSVQWARDLPRGASQTPIGMQQSTPAAYNPGVIPIQAPPLVNPVTPVQQTPIAPPPYPQILQPQMPQQVTPVQPQAPAARSPDARLVQHVKDQGYTYLKLIGMGYTEQSLIAEGLMNAT